MKLIDVQVLNEVWMIWSRALSSAASIGNTFVKDRQQFPSRSDPLMIHPISTISPTSIWKSVTFFFTFFNKKKFFNFFFFFLQLQLRSLQKRVTFRVTRTGCSSTTLSNASKGWRSEEFYRRTWRSDGRRCWLFICCYCWLLMITRAPFFSVLLDEYRLWN